MFDQKRFYNRETNSVAFCAIDLMSFIPPSLLCKIKQLTLCSNILANHDKGRLQNPETPCRYIIARVNESIYFLFFYHSRNITKKFGPLFTIFWALGAAEPGAV